MSRALRAATLPVLVACFAIAAYVPNWDYKGWALATAFAWCVMLGMTDDHDKRKLK